MKKLYVGIIVLINTSVCAMQFYDLTYDLHQAVEEGQAEKVNALIRQGTDTNRQDLQNRRPLHMAIKQGRDDMCKKLLEGKADANSTDEQGKLALALALETRDEDKRVQLCTLLISLGAQPHLMPDSYGLYKERMIYLQKTLALQSPPKKCCSRCRKQCVIL